MAENPETNLTPDESVQPIGGEQEPTETQSLPGEEMIDPRRFLGYPILDSAPDHDALEGSLICFDDGSDEYLYVYLGGGWRCVGPYPASGNGHYVEGYTSSNTTTLTTAHTWYRIDPLTLGEGSDTSTDDIYLDTTNGKVEVNAGGAGRYLVTVSGSFRTDKAALVYLRVAKNGAPLANVIQTRCYTYAASIDDPFSMSGLVELADGDDLSIEAMSTTASVSFRMNELNISVVRV